MLYYKTPDPQTVTIVRNYIRMVDCHRNELAILAYDIGAASCLIEPDGTFAGFEFFKGQEPANQFVPMPWKGWYPSKDNITVQERLLRLPSPGSPTEFNALIHFQPFYDSRTGERVYSPQFGLIDDTVYFSLDHNPRNHYIPPSSIIKMSESQYWKETVWFKRVFNLRMPAPPDKKYLWFPAASSRRVAS
jgi:hypothetical protein